MLLSVVCNGFIYSDDEIYGQTCASCSGVETSSECEHTTRCDPNEVSTNLLCLRYFYECIVSN